MSFLELANDNFMYVICGGALLVILVILICFMRMAWKRALAIGYTNKKLFGIVKTTLAVSLGPALSILIPLLVLIRVLGAPWSWLRLSVVGSAPMEMSVANLALGFGGFGELGGELPASAFGLVAIVVSISIPSGILLNIFFNKRVSNSYEKMRQADPSFASLLTSVLFGSFIAAPTAGSVATSVVSLLVLITAFVLFAILMVLVKKFNLKLVGQYSFAIGLIASMGMAILWNALLG